MDNGPARQAGVAVKLQQAGDTVADMFEVYSVMCVFDYSVELQCTV